MGVGPTSGTRLYIAEPGPLSPEPSWVEIGEVTQIGDIGGRNYGVIRHDSLALRRTQKFKGQYDPGNPTIQIGRDFNDAGQAMLEDANESDENYNFKIVLNDAPDGVPSEGIFQALVTNFVNNIGNATSVVGATFTVELNSDVIWTPASL